MVDLPGDAADVALAVGRIASAPGTGAQRAEALLDQMHRLVPYDAAGVVLFNPCTRQLVPFTDRGFDAALRTMATGQKSLQDSDRIAKRGPRRPVYLCGAGAPAQELPGWTRVLCLAGHQEGVLLGLFAPGRRYLGFIGLFGGPGLHPTPPVKELLSGLVPAIAHAVDPLRSMAAAAELVAGCEAGAALFPDGHALRLPGLPAHPRLEPGSIVLLLLAAHMARDAPYSVFLAPTRSTEPTGDYDRITVLRCPQQPPYHLDALVLISPAGDLYGLTPRELEIVGLLVEGWTNQRIAAFLGIAERTVAAHIEHILAKLAAASRTQVAVWAVSQGLYLPSRARASAVRQRSAAGRQINRLSAKRVNGQ